ncbi:phosphoglycolate phosphatase [Ketobacter alkanivorans]|uniref:Phosphoglycolate phosphatase n=1 Tax=Ketobacter alkanivorans TaxID=1917421 RepID=A0A2K9LN49_9GAMM|nr:phosphoglycolate phosphatase [Ketobacter alkanivorans]AUM13799.1 phosphoglycolate phosphatase [Ketobacter alkanivorans]
MLIKLTGHFQGHLPQLIAFDLDGTLVDSVPDIAAATDRMLVALGHPAAGEQRVRSWVGNGAGLLVKRALADSYDPAAVAAVSDAEFDPAMAAFREYYAEENGRLTRLYAGVSDVLNAFYDLGVPMAVITNKPKIFADPLLAELDIARYFELVLGGECLPQKKPHPMPLEQASRQFGVSSARSLMVGDSRNDVEAAKAAGWVSAALTYGYNHGEPVANSEPDWLLDDFRELIL